MNFVVLPSLPDGLVAYLYRYDIEKKCFVKITSRNFPLFQICSNFGTRDDTNYVVLRIGSTVYLPTNFKIFTILKL